MLNPKLTAVVTALILFGGSQSGNAAYDIEQLRVIDQHIQSKNCGGLRTYLQSNPGIMSGSDPLAQELRTFVDGVDGGLIDCLAAQPDSGSAVSEFFLEQIY